MQLPDEKKRHFYPTTAHITHTYLTTVFLILLLLSVTSSLGSVSSTTPHGARNNTISVKWHPGCLHSPPQPSLHPSKPLQNALPLLWLAGLLKWPPSSLLTWAEKPRALGVKPSSSYVLCQGKREICCGGRHLHHLSQAVITRTGICMWSHQHPMYISVEKPSPPKKSSLSRTHIKSCSSLWQKT